MGKNLDKYSNEQSLDFKKHAFYLSKSVSKSGESIPKPEDTGLVLVKMHYQIWKANYHLKENM